MITYRIGVEDAHAHLFRVSVSVPQPAAGQRLSLPVWIPGSYLIREFARHLSAVVASQGGRPVPLTQVDKATWQAHCPDAVDTPLVVSYRVYAFDTSVRAAFLDAHRGFFNGTGVFLRVEGREDEAQRLEIDALPAGWRVATALPPAPGAGQGGSYRAADYDELVDHPVELGRFWSGRFEAAGVPHDYVVAGALPDFDGDRLLADARRICEAQIAFWHGAGAKPPFDRYVFLHNLVEDGHGGLEHRASTALISPRRDMPSLLASGGAGGAGAAGAAGGTTAGGTTAGGATTGGATAGGATASGATAGGPTAGGPTAGGTTTTGATAGGTIAGGAAAGRGGSDLSDGQVNLLGLISHEYFHTWNVKRLRPADFARLDYTRENYTELLWFFEGFTSYYDDLFLVRTGLIDAARYLRLVGKTIAGVLALPGRRVQSVAASSFDAWVKYYRSDENTPNATVSYYTKGSLVALALDLTLRIEGRGTLDDVMRALWATSGGGPVDEVAIASALQRVGGRPFDAELAAWVHGTDDLPLPALLASFGVDWKGEAPTLAQRLGLRVAESPLTGVKVSHVLRDGAAERAGLSAGDELLAVDGWRIRRLEEASRLLVPGIPATVSLFRDQRLSGVSLTLPPASSAAAAGVTLVPASGASAVQLAAQKAWLGG